MTSTTELSDSPWDAWIGCTRTLADRVRLQPVSFMEMTLDRDPVLRLPPLWHWLFCLETARLSSLGRDGHPAKGGFLPPVDLPRRMWAGGRFVFHGPISIGADIEKRSTVVSVVPKVGRSGRLCFVTVRHDVFSEARLCLVEEHDIVYREDPKPDAVAGEPAKAPANGAISEQVAASEVMLFRYSALTFNGHRIHHDRDYAIGTEGYGGLVVHGPLIATLLADLAVRVRPERTMTAFEFRAMSALLDTDPFSINAKSGEEAADLWATGPVGELAMAARADYAEK